MGRNFKFIPCGLVMGIGAGRAEQFIKLTIYEFW